jgi:hypothetical protein
MKTLPETFYKKNSDFCTKNDVRLKKTPNKTPKNLLEVGFFRRVILVFIGRVFLGGFFIANPAAAQNHSQSHNEENFYYLKYF